LFFIVFASKIGLSWDVDPALREKILVVGASPAQCPDIQERFDETLKSLVKLKSFHQRFSEFKKFQEEASRMGLKNEYILCAKDESKTVFKPEFFIEQIVELRGDSPKAKPGRQIYQYPESSIFMDAQSSDLSGPLANLWFGTPETLKKLKKSHGYFTEIHLNDMCKITPDQNDCDRGDGTNWPLILEHASSLLLPGGKLKIAPCGRSLNFCWDKLGFKEQSYQNIIHVQKHERFEKKFLGEKKEYGIIVSYVFKDKNIKIIVKKNDPISRWIHSNPSENLKIIEKKNDPISRWSQLNPSENSIRNPRDFFRYIEHDRAKELREILNKITAKDLEEFVGKSDFRYELFLKENCNSLEKIRKTNGNAPLQEKLFDILFPLIDWQDDSKTTKDILRQCIKMGLTERMKGLLKEKYKNKRKVFVGSPCEILAFLFENTNIKLSLWPRYASLVNSSDECIYSLSDSD
jgi:hypothetical protein